VPPSGLFPTTWASSALTGFLGGGSNIYHQHHNPQAQQIHARRNNKISVRYKIQSMVQSSENTDSAVKTTLDKLSSIQKAKTSK
jgi:hypothetical protein